MVVAVIVRVSMTSPRRGSVYPVFATAGQAFADGRPLYENTDGAFRYAPIWATFFSLSRHVDQQWASIGWRLMNLVVFVWGAIRFQRHFFSHWSPAQLCLWWCLMLPICLGSFNNAQANLLLLGLLLGATATFAEDRWLLSGLLLAVAISLKIYPIALALLLLLVRPRRLFPPLVFGLMLLAALPFAFQSSEYVLSQYRSWYHSTTGDLRIDRDISDTNRDVWLLLRITHAPVDYHFYQVMQLISALVLAAWTWFNRKQIIHQASSSRKLILLFSFAVTWMLVFGPASESSTYALVAPMMAMAVVLCMTTPQTILNRFGVAVSFILMIVAHLGSAFPNGTVPHEFGIHPVSTILLADVIPLLSHLQSDHSD